VLGAGVSNLEAHRQSRPFGAPNVPESIRHSVPSQMYTVGHK
jgi:hypothetical protein